MTQNDEGGPSLEVSMAQQLREHRRTTGMSQRELADLTKNLGYAIPRDIIANIEAGRRQQISVREWLVLAIALDVPPGEMISEVDSKVELVPGLVVDGRHLTSWLAGMAPMRFGLDAPDPILLHLLKARHELDTLIAAREGGARYTDRTNP